MAIKLRDLLKLPSLKNMELLSGEKGLDNIVTWTYDCEMNSFSEWLQGGELIFITGFGISTDESSLISIVAEAHKCSSAGLVFFADKYIKEIPQKVLDFSNKYNLPIFKIPWKAKLVDITREILSFIIGSQERFESLYNWAEDIFFGSEEQLRAAEENAGQFGFDTNSSHQIAIIKSDSYNHSVLKTTDGKKHLNYFFITAQELLHKYNSKILCIPHGSYLILIIPEGNNTNDGTSKLLNNVYNELLLQNSEMKFCAGIGRTFTSIKDVRKSYIDAERIIKLASSSKLRQNILSYRDLGIFRLFYEIPDKHELMEFYNDIMGPLLEYDKLNHTEFVKTLGMLFENKLNRIKASQALYIHRNSLVYRLNRIEKILNLKLDDPETLMELQTCILIGKFLSL